MTDTTPCLALPLIAAGQAQKELWHNEALVRLDALVQGAVIAACTEVPPIAPTPGDSWIVGATPSGAWAGHAHAIAWWSEGGWRFAAPHEGMMLWVRTAGCWAVREGSGWQLGAVAARSLRVDGLQVVGARQPAIAAPAGGEIVDLEARAALVELLAAARTHGLIAS